MFSRRNEENLLPVWLWFFLILPIVLIVALLYRRKRLPRIAQRLRSLQQLREQFQPAPRYVEPDSIPLEIRTGEVVAIEGESDMDDEDAAIARAMAAEENEGGIVVQPETSPSAQDDLEIIEGIGPAIAKLLRDAGIVTFRQLAEAPVERLDEILTIARLRRLADPATWPEQSALAANGDWDGLKQLQDTLKGGRRPKTS